MADATKNFRNIMLIHIITNEERGEKSPKDYSRRFLINAQKKNLSRDSFHSYSPPSPASPSTGSPCTAIEHVIVIVPSVVSNVIL